MHTFQFTILAKKRFLFFRIFHETIYSEYKIFGVKIQVLIAANNDLAHHLLIFAHEYHQVVVKMNGGTTLHLLTHAKVRGLVE